MSKITLVNGQNVDFSLDAQTSGTGTMKTPDLAGATRYQVPALSAAAAAEIAKLGVHGADIASATTTNLETATGELVDVTGTTTITAITLSEGHRRVVRFTGILTLTHGASLVLPGAANIVTAAGDVAVFEGYASSVVRCMGYQRAALPPFNPASPGAIGGTTAAAISGTTGTFSGVVTSVGSGPASPLLIPNLALFLDPASYSAGGASWADSSGLGLTAARQAAGSTYSATGLNGLPAVVMDGSAYFTVASFLDTSWNNTWTSFFVGSKAVTTDLVYTGNATNSMYFGWGQNNGAYALAGTNCGAPTVAMNYTDVVIEALRYDGANVTIRQNGVQFVKKAATANLFSVSSALGVGATAAGTIPWNGKMGHFIVFKRALTDTEIASVERWLGNYYGLLNKTRIVFRGDSLMLGFASTAVNPAAKAVQILSNGIQCIDAANAGVTGLGADTMLATDVAQVDAFFDPTRLNVAVCNGGINDLLASTATATIQTYVETWHRARRAKGYRTVVCTITSSTNAGNPGGFEAARIAFNLWVRANWKTFADALADLGANPSIGAPLAADDTTTYFNADKTHMKDAGYTVMGTIIAEAIGRAINQQVTQPLTVPYVTADATVSIPAGYKIDSLVIENTTANAVTGGIKIGTTNGGTEVAAAIAVGANALLQVTDAELLKRLFSMSTATTLYLQDVTAWNSASLNFYFTLRKVGY